jgi:hypothetical protein
MTLVRERDHTTAGEAHGTRRHRRPRRFVVAVGAGLIGLAVLAAWLRVDVFGPPAVYVVGDSITALSQTAITQALASAGYDPTVTAAPGVKIGQAQANMSSLARNEPWAWIIELGTNDAAASDAIWPLPFLSEWSLMSSSPCVIYVTVSPRAGLVGAAINASMTKLAASRRNVHILDWGRMEYQNPAWVSVDGIHPTPAGEAMLAALETNELQHACS